MAFIHVALSEARVVIDFTRIVLQFGLIAITCTIADFMNYVTLISITTAIHYYYVSSCNITHDFDIRIVIIFRLFRIFAAFP